MAKQLVLRLLGRGGETSFIKHGFSSCQWDLGALKYFGTITNIDSDEFSF